VQAGVTKVVHQETELPERWVEQMNWSFQLLDEADVEVVSIPVGDE